MLFQSKVKVILPYGNILCYKRSIAREIPVRERLGAFFVMSIEPVQGVHVVTGSTQSPVYPPAGHKPDLGKPFYKPTSGD
jgi:hypothetical protein